MMRNRGTRTVAEVADDLGVAGNQLHRWAKELEKGVLAKRNEQGESLEKRTDLRFNRSPQHIGDAAL